MHVCTSLQTDNHASTPPLCFLQAGCPSCRPTNSVKALKAQMEEETVEITGTALKKTAELIQDVISGAHSFVRLGDHWRQLVSTVESVWQPVSCRLPL